MKIIIAGGRDFDNQDYMWDELDPLEDFVTEVVCGCARGADQLGSIWAVESGIDVKKFPAEWDKLGKKAGYIRNRQMGEYADALIAFWDGKSKGTKHMIDIAKELGLQYKIIYY